MEYFIMFIVASLSVCILLAFFAIISVGYYIAYDMYAYYRNSKDGRRSKCKWSCKSELDDFTTSCGEIFHDSSESGNPPTDWLTYCPYCGGKVNIK